MPKGTGWFQMDGLSHNRSSEHESKIDSWMHAIIEDGGIDRYDDLHIDRVDAEWKNRDLWFAAALQAYVLALKVRDRNRFEFSVVLGFSLQSSERRIGVNFRTREEFEREFDRTPPSLYLFPPDREPWAQGENANARIGTRDMVVEKVDAAIFGTLTHTKGCFYLEFRNVDASEYFRSVLVVG